METQARPSSDSGSSGGQLGGPRFNSETHPKLGRPGLRSLADSSGPPVLAERDLQKLVRALPQDPSVDTPCPAGSSHQRRNDRAEGWSGDRGQQGHGHPTIQLGPVGQASGAVTRVLGDLLLVAVIPQASGSCPSPWLSQRLFFLQSLVWCGGHLRCHQGTGVSRTCLAHGSLLAEWVCRARLCSAPAFGGVPFGKGVLAWLSAS